LDVIADIGPPARRAVPALIRAFAGGRRQAAAALGAMGPASADAVPYLVEAILNDDTCCSWREISEALGKIGPAGITPLIDALSSKNVRVRVAAAECIGEIGPPAAAAVPRLMAMLVEDDLAAQVNAIKALGQIGTEARPARRLLRKLLDRKNYWVCRKAGQALKRIDAA
jgi:HEAT repeat protein